VGSTERQKEATWEEDDENDEYGAFLTAERHAQRVRRPVNCRDEVPNTATNTHHKWIDGEAARILIGSMTANIQLLKY